MSARSSDNSQLADNCMILEATACSMNSTNLLAWLKMDNGFIATISAIQLAIYLDAVYYPAMKYNYFVRALFDLFSLFLFLIKTT